MHHSLVVVQRTRIGIQLQDPSRMAPMLGRTNLKVNPAHFMDPKGRGFAINIRDQYDVPYFAYLDGTTPPTRPEVKSDMDLGVLYLDPKNVAWMIYERDTSTVSTANTAGLYGGVTELQVDDGDSIVLCEVSFDRELALGALSAGVSDSEFDKILRRCNVGSRSRMVWYDREDLVKMMPVASSSTSEEDHPSMKKLFKAVESLTKDSSK